MPQKDHKPQTDAFFDRLLGCQNPRAEALDDGLRQAQLLCGRWIALRRARRGLTLEALADQTGLSLEALWFLEAGLADESFDPNGAACLTRQLSGPYGDDAWIGMLVAIAAGDIGRPNDRIMLRVVADLDVIYHKI
jgi:transcriptional regulator with XRE-family HTH domain